MVVLVAAPVVEEVLGVISKLWLSIIVISITLVIGNTSTVFALDDFEDLPPLNETHVYVQDHAGIFTSSQIDQLQKRSNENKNDYELMIVTMKDINSSHPKTYAKRLFNTYQVGFKSDRINIENINGVIILFDGEHRVTIYTDPQLSHYFTDKKIKQIVKDTTESEFEHHDYSKGLIRLYTQIEKEIPKGVAAATKQGIELKQPESTSNIQNTEESGDSFSDNVWFVIKYGKWLGVVLGTFYLIMAGVAFVSPADKEVEESTHTRLVRMRKLAKKRKKSRAKKAERDKEKKHSSVDENKKYKHAMRDYKDK